MTINHEALRVIRQKDGHSIRSLAAHPLVKISPQYLSDIEAGRRTLKRNPGLIKALASALNVPTSMLERRAPGEDSAA